MSDILCLYCTRTQQTRKLMEKIAGELDAELVRLSDGVNRSGALGYMSAAAAAVKKELPELLPVRTQRPIQDYGTIILGAPIWAETVCPLAKAFLRRYAPLLRGEVFYVVTHAAENPYENAIAQLDEYLCRAHRSHLSVCTKKGSAGPDLDAFLAGLR